jgi:hypothetical protein
MSGSTTLNQDPKHAHGVNGTRNKFAVKMNSPRHASSPLEGTGVFLRWVGVQGDSGARVGKGLQSAHANAFSRTANEP